MCTGKSHGTVPWNLRPFCSGTISMVPACRSATTSRTGSLFAGWDHLVPTRKKGRRVMLNAVEHAVNRESGSVVTSLIPRRGPAFFSQECADCVNVVGIQLELNGPMLMPEARVTGALGTTATKELGILHCNERVVHVCFRNVNRAWARHVGLRERERAKAVENIINILHGNNQFLIFTLFISNLLG